MTQLHVDESKKSHGVASENSRRLVISFFQALASGPQQAARRGAAAGREREDRGEVGVGEPEGAR